METVATEKTGSESALVLPADFVPNLRRNAPLMITEAKKNGAISTREIAAILHPRLASDRHLFKVTIAQLGVYLNKIGVPLARGGVDLEKRRLPLPVFALQISVSLSYKNVGESDMRFLASVLEKKDEFDSADLALYQAVIRKFPVLSHLETVELFKRRQQGDLEAHYCLILHNLKLVFAWANKYQNRGLDLADLAQEGILGLMKAIEKFNWTRGYHLSTYATWWVRQKMKRALSDKARTIRLPVHLEEALNKIKRAQEDLAKETGRQATDEEIGEKLGMNSRYVAKILEAVDSSESGSLDETIDGVDGEMKGLHGTLADPSTISPSDLLEAKEKLEEVASEVRALLVKLSTLPRFDDRYRQIFLMRYGLEGQFFSRPTLETIAEKFGVTRSRIGQIIDAGWERLGEVGIRGGDPWLLGKLAQIEELETVTSSFVRI